MSIFFLATLLAHSVAAVAMAVGVAVSSVLPAGREKRG